MGAFPRENVDARVGFGEPIFKEICIFRKCWFLLFTDKVLLGFNRECALLCSSPSAGWGGYGGREDDVRDMLNNDRQKESVGNILGERFGMKQLVHFVWSMGWTKNRNGRGL